MPIGILVTARMGSTRLVDKHLRDIGGRPALSYLLERIDREFGTELADGSAVALIATGGEARNAPLGALTTGTHARLFHGDDNNVPLRHLQAARQLGLSGIVSVDGDDLFCAPEAMRKVFAMLQDGVAVPKTSGLPLGMNAWGYTTAALEQALSGANLALLETGWGRIFEGLPSRTEALVCPDADAVRATLDYDDDLAFFTRCILEIPGWRDLPSADFVREIVARDIHATNAGLNQEYWQNFSLNIARENTTREAQK